MSCNCSCADAKDRARKIASHLLRIQAVFLRPTDPFTWASGIKSPIYCDNRLTLSDVQVRADVESGLAALIRQAYPQAEAILGTATAGIAHGAIAAHLLELPTGYVRSSNKSHGRQNKIEGRFAPGTKVVVVEDLISTGGSVIEAARALREAGLEVLGIVSLFTYGMSLAAENFSSAGFDYKSLTDLDTLLDVAVEEEYVSAAEAEMVLKFRSNPRDESWMG